MGITNLKKLIGQTSVKRHLQAYANKRLGVDTSIFLYRFVYNDDKNAILDGLLRQLRQFHRYHITPIYVFDGKASADVKMVIEQRQQRRQRVREALDTLSVELGETMEELGDPVSAAIVMGQMEMDEFRGNAKVEVPFVALDVPLFIADSDDEEYAATTTQSDANDDTLEPEDLMLRALKTQSRILSLEKQLRRPTSEMVEDCIHLFELLGVPYRQSPGESDVTLAEMMQSGEIHGIISEDTDMLPYGCECFITDFKCNSDYVVEYQVSRVLQDLKMSREQFVDLCILCGCDYSEKIYKIAIKGALEKLRLYGTIEGVIEHIKSKPALVARHTYPENFMQQVQKARNMFLLRSPDGSKSTHEPVIQSWNFDIAEASSSDFQQFLLDRAINTPGQWSMLTKPFIPKNQKSINDFFAPRKVASQPTPLQAPPVQQLTPVQAPPVQRQAPPVQRLTQQAPPVRNPTPVQLAALQQQSECLFTDGEDE